MNNKVEGRYSVHDKRNIFVVICDTNILQQLTNDDGDHKTLEMLTDLPCKCSRVIVSKGKTFNKKTLQMLNKSFSNTNFNTNFIYKNIRQLNVY
jgi:hypothetical protein